MVCVCVFVSCVSQKGHSWLCQWLTTPPTMKHMHTHTQHTIQVPLSGIPRTMCYGHNCQTGWDLCEGHNSMISIIGCVHFV